MTPLRRLALAVLAAALAGCSAVPQVDRAKVGPFFKPTNIKTASSRLPPDLRRVLVLPVASDRPLPEETLATLDETVRNELNRLSRFEVISLSREDLARYFGVRQMGSTETLPAAFAERIFSPDNRYGADAILLIDITAYTAYPPLSLGLRAKLARVRDREIVWAADHVFAAAEPAVANSARRHAFGLGADRGPGDLSHTILQNPTRFAGYASHETFNTLPLR